jgi:phage terminase large subunit-like protein
MGAGTETYIDVNDVKACRVKKGLIDWKGKVVYIGVDLSMTTDNTSVSMVGLDDNNNIIAESFAFIPEDRIEEKTINEKVNYREHMRGGKVMACGDRVIDYGYVEQFILSLEERYGVQIQAIGYDRYNAMSTAQKLEAAGYNLVEVRQHSSVLHPPTKLLKEKILTGEFEYEDNPMLEINFANARCTYDTNQNLYVNKKKSNGKVDMVVSLINAVYLLNQDAILGGDYFTAQVV